MKPLLSQCILWGGIIMHLAWGVMIVTHADATMRTSGISHLFDMPFGASENMTGIVLIAASLLAALAIAASVRCPSVWAYIALVTPQQIIMMLTLFGIIEVVMTGVYANGYAPPHNPRSFIAADQMAAAVLVVAHTLAVAEGAKNHGKAR